MSSVIDEDTARAVDAGRETVGDILTSAQTELKKAFMAFLVTFLGTVMAMRLYVWNYLEANTKSQLEAAVADELDLIARTPFDVILMQIKIGLIVGAIVTIVVLLYLTRKKVMGRIDAAVPVTRSKVYGFIGLSVLLALAGLFYAYTLFFPLMFKVLAEQAYQAGVKPSYGIVRYTEFLLLLTISFALAAQLPLFMGALSYAEIVPYETFRDKWRYAVLGIFVFGAVFSPPDPFTQIMWAVPLLTLYALSLGLAKILTNVRRASASGSPVEPGTYKRKAYHVGGAFGLGWLLTAAAIGGGATAWINEQVMPAVPERIGVPILADIELPATLDAGGPLEWAAAGFRVGLLLGAIVLVIHLVDVLRQPVIEQAYRRSSGDPEDVDLERLNAAGVRAAPIEAFASLSEDEVLDLARDAMDDEPEKAEALFERWDEAQERDEDAEDDATTATSGAAATGGATADDAADEAGNPVSDTAVGMLDAFTEEETTEDDIGGYLYDIRFILDSLRSRMFILFAIFLGTFGGSFGYLYWRGIEDIMEQFTARVPDERFRPGAGATEATDIVIALHPVEVLIFIVKFSAIVAAIFTLPPFLYYAWPAIQKRGFASGDGDRRGFLVWGAILIAGAIGGSILGFFGIAPMLISYLVSDAIASGMVISYRIRSLLWIVFFLTIGVGLFVNVPITMALFHYSGLIGFDRMYRGWRHVCFGIFVFAAMFTPRGVLTMLVFAIPAAAAYLLGLAILWVLTLPGRRRRGSREPQAS